MRIIRERELSSQEMDQSVQSGYDHDAVRALLQANGYKYAGEGNYSEVWISKDRVVKFSMVEDLCWLQFLEWVEEQRESIYLPKIYNLRKYEIEDDETMFIATMESLESIENYRRRTKIKDMDDLALYVWLELNMFGGNDEDVVALINKYPQILASYDFDDSEEALKRVIEEGYDHEFVGIIYELKQITGNRCDWDLGADNIMYRPSTDSPVITDPYG